jgi:hypothetical protein
MSVKSACSSSAAIYFCSVTLCVVFR